MDIWEILGISPVKDKRLIKKAYAARSREIHPEEQPEEFMRLYEAYRMALYPAYERRMNTWRLQDRALREMQLIEREDKSRRVIFWIVCLLVLLFALYGFWKV